VSELAGKKQTKIYRALLEGAYEGYVDEALYRHVLDRVPDAKRKTLVKAAMAAMRDTAIEDTAVLETVLGLAIKLRISRKKSNAAAGGQPAKVL
jgi:hypothetical protein